MTTERQSILYNSIISGLFVLLLLSSATLGLSSLPSALTLAICAIFVLFSIAMRAKVARPTFLALAFLGLNFASAVVFGGIASIRTSGIISWVANEGRIFLYYWPMMMAIEAVPAGSSGFSRRFHKMMVFMAPFALVVVLARWVVHVELFSTTHSAGAFTAMLCIYHYHYFSAHRKKLALIMLLVSAVALLGTNSRTSLLAVVFSLGFSTLSSGNIKQVLGLMALVAIGAVVMPILFSNQFDRVLGAANFRTLSEVERNFGTALGGIGNFEVANAWAVSDKIDIEGDANLEIRGILWGRAAREGLMSPITGIGFGRFNDLGRNFLGVPYVFYPVVSADYNSPSDFTAHNSLLHIFAELGFPGLLLFLGFLRTFWKPFNQVSSDGDPHLGMWRRIGKTSVVCLLFMSMTQHSFGAPIYGMTIMMLVGFSYSQLRVRAAAGPAGRLNSLLLPTARISAPNSLRRSS